MVNSARFAERGRMIAGLLTALATGLVAFAVTWLVYRNGTRLGLVQAANERSSHTVPTARGGGVGIVAGGIVATAVFAAATPWPTLPILALSLVMATMGFVDDRISLPAILRLIGQIVLVALLVYFLPVHKLIEQVVPPYSPFYLPALVPPIAVVLVVLWVNFFNFMDGIDGIAASQAVFMLVAGTLLAIAGGVAIDTPMLWWFIGIAAATGGFLVLNWPPAKIFMGDAGSTWLGFILAAVAYWTVALGWLNLWQWLILGALFIADATLTLVRRVLRGESPLKAHRLHAYQHLSRRWGGHAPVTLLYIAVNVVLLFPLALASGLLPGIGLVATAAAYAPLVAGLLWAGAGAKEVAA